MTEKQRRVLLILIPTIIFILIIIGISYAYIVFTAKGTETNTITAGCLKFSLEESDSQNAINIVPLTDEQGNSLTPYNYSITNTCTIEAYYETSFNVLNTSIEGKDNNIKLSLTGANYIEPSLLTNFDSVTLNKIPTDVRNSYLIDTGYLKVGETKIFNLRTWLDYNTTSFDGNFNYKIIVTGIAGEGPSFASYSTGYQILSKSNLISNTATNPNYSYIAPLETNGQLSGLYRIKGNEDKFTYYYRGEVTDNYVKFGTYQENVSYTYKNLSNEDVIVNHNAGDDIIWRIVRINEDGSLRLILDDFIGSSVYNTDATLSTNTDYSISTIKTNIDNWYNKHLKDNYSDFIADTGFCSDNDYTSQNDILYYQSYTRNINSKNPSYICNNLLKVSNNKLTNPIGLLTADELAMAGNVYNISNVNNYLYKNSNWYTLTPSKFDSSVAYNFIGGENSLGFSSVNTSLAIRPVINLSYNLVMAGNGLIDDPYTVKKIIEGKKLVINANGGLYNNLSSYIYNLYSNEEIELDIPIKENYTFAGWNVSDGTIITNNKIIMGNEDISITAIWGPSQQIYTYTGDYETYIVPATGIYKIELWGAGNVSDVNKYDGGGYVSGDINLTIGEKLYFYIGALTNPFNGGGASIGTSPGGASYGNGATDVRIINGAWDDNSSLISRIMVAGASGRNADYSNGSSYGICKFIVNGNVSGGGLYATNSAVSSNCSSSSYNAVAATGGSQIAGGIRATTSYGSSSLGTDGSFGKGGSGGPCVDSYYTCAAYNAQAGMGGGSGYYGGGSCWGPYMGQNSCVGSAGGSSFISGHTGCVTVTSTSSSTPKSGCTTGTTDNSCSIHPNGYVFTNTKMIDGSGYSWTNTRGSYEQMPNPTGENYELGIGHTGNGYARITFVGISS